MALMAWKKRTLNTNKLLVKVIGNLTSARRRIPVQILESTLFERTLALKAPGPVGFNSKFNVTRRYPKFSTKKRKRIMRWNTSIYLAVSVLSGSNPSVNFRVKTLTDTYVFVTWQYRAFEIWIRHLRDSAIQHVVYLFSDSCIIYILFFLPIRHRTKS